jgi:divalent metal cation (Fe/Co/Zn/Cd) transporter
MIIERTPAPPSEDRLFRIAIYLSLITIVANLIEGFASTLLGFRDETLTLFGFGIDSFIEVISAVGITSMVIRLKRNPDDERSRIESFTLRITGVSFYLLTAGLLSTAILNAFQKNRPESTFWGIVISVISLSVMVFLMQAKLKIGRQLKSDPIIADANCTKACIYMSLVLLISSLVYTVFPVPYLDSLGAIGIAYFSFHEGREAFEKASRKLDFCSDCID